MAEGEEKSGFVQIKSPNKIDITDKSVEEVLDIAKFAEEAGVDVVITGGGKTEAQIVATAVVPKKK